MKKITGLEMAGISKSFGEVSANRNISLSVSSGEVLGLLGENGAGKTTLMNILYGLYRPDKGTIRINGNPVAIRSPRDSIRAGIGMIHQHFMLVQNHTVLENLILGYDQAPMVLPHRYMRVRVAEFEKKYGIHIDPDKQVWELSAGEQQKVEILKALLREADLLIMDEPTSVLTPQEADDLYRVIRRMKDEGHSVILISHKLDEIMSICTRVTVLRKGETVGQAEVSAVDKAELARMMIGREVMFSFKKTPREPGDVVLEVRDLHVISDRNVPAVRGVSFSIHKNEIFGIAGVSGNGQREMVEAITGLRKAKSGDIVLEGSSIVNESARVVNSRGVTHVPEERIKFGIVPNLLIYENAVLKQHTMSPFSRVMFLDYDSIRDHAMELVDRFQVSAPSIHVPTKNLSGGNIQKLIIAREIHRKPALLVASHPTYGLDVGATEYIRSQLLIRRDEGGAVLLVSEDLEELFEVCDRIAVMFKGQIMGILSPGDRDIEDIGLMMTGSIGTDTPKEQGE
ncbi:MAG: ABC transporter ATP-binding protein [Spirochaetales bacterium]|nr:ABC transporter ATP-binding protein [Spirochaetales bacterium]